MNAHLDRLDVKFLYAVEGIGRFRANCWQGNVLIKSFFLHVTGSQDTVNSTVKG